MGDWRGREWDSFGRTDPYFGVIADPSLHAGAIDDAGRAAFFATGEAEVRSTLSILRQLVGRELQWRRALDFGCGVGRLTIPLARVFERVVGVDVSSAMLEEARRNSAAAGVTNAEYALSLPGLDGITGQFDFVHSFIVLQHIAPKIGYGLIGAMLDRLTPDGGGMLHFTYGRETGRLRRAVQIARRSSRVVHRLLNVVQRRPIASPLMAMFEYDAARIFELLRHHGCGRIAGTFTNHGGHLGVMLCFTRVGGEQDGDREIR